MKMTTRYVALCWTNHGWEFVGTTEEAVVIGDTRAEVLDRVRMAYAGEENWVDWEEDRDTIRIVKIEWPDEDPVITPTRRRS
jgi:hypothetical protein